MPALPSVLISSAGRRGALVKIFRQAIAQTSQPGMVIGSDRSSTSAACHLADRALQAPPISSDEFIEWNLNVCAEHDIKLVIPTIDTELAKFSQSRERFKEIGVTVNIAPERIIQAASNKKLTHQWFQELGILTVEQVDLDDALAGGSLPPEPWIAKPAAGSSSIGVMEPASLDELANLKGKDYILQRKALGNEYTIDFFVLAGRLVSAVPRLRIETRAGEVSKGRTEAHPEALALVQRLVELEPTLFGVGCIQAIFEKATGTMAAIEVNARFGGGFPLSWEAGAKYPQWLWGVRARPRIGTDRGVDCRAFDA